MSISLRGVSVITTYRAAPNTENVQCSVRHHNADKCQNCQTFNKVHRLSQCRDRLRTLLLKTEPKPRSQQDLWDFDYGLQPVFQKLQL